jgi:crotonobetaine/carnitine-CoA ligase
MNALNGELLEELINSLRRCRAKVILQGAGDRAFCAGEDLKETMAPNGTQEELKLAFQRLQDITRLTSTAPAIFIAAIQGYAVGGGAEIALAADFVIGRPNTKFRFPEVAIGHAATGGITQRLVQMCGLLRAKELLLCGRFISATEALQYDMLTELVDDPKARAMELAHHLARMPSISASNSKLSVERAVFPNQEGVLQDEVAVAVLCFAQPNSNQAFTDF